MRSPSADRDPQHSSGPGGEMADRVRWWYVARRSGGRDATVSLSSPPTVGYSNDLVFVAVEVVGGGAAPSRDDLVIRLVPAGPPLFPDYDLEMQAAVQREAARAGVPVAHPVTVEPDASWLGRPFLVMPRVEGRHPGEAPATTGWITSLPVEDQRRLHTRFLEVLADIHAMPFRDGPLPDLLRGGRHGAGLAEEVDWWEGFARWACGDGDPTPLVDLFNWCRAHLPATEPPASVLWGDVRLGNVVVGDDLRPAAVLDWEMATLGPAESDVAWFTALSALTDRVLGTRVPGFLDRDGIVAHHERRLGRPLRDMAWHEAFALARAAAASVRTDVVAASAEGRDLPGPASHFLVRYARRFMESLA